MIYCTNNVPHDTFQSGAYLLIWPHLSRLGTAIRGLEVANVSETRSLDVSERTSAWGLYVTELLISPSSMISNYPYFEIGSIFADLIRSRLVP